MMTVAYITILDTFTPYDAAYAVIRIVLIGFFMLGLLYLERIKLMERITLPKAAVLKWFLPLSVLILAAVGFGLAAPKSDPNWPDPVPFLKKVTNHDRVPAGESKIGYGNHDESLGGPFQQDATPVFTWQEKSAHISAWKQRIRIREKAGLKQTRACRISLAEATLKICGLIIRFPQNGTLYV